MIPLTISQQQGLQAKSRELGLSHEVLSTAFDLLRQNRQLVNAIDHRSEMDDYIYRAVLQQLFERRKRRAEEDFEGTDEAQREIARTELAILSREQIFSDPFYRAVLPLIVRVLGGEPIRRLHAEEASAIVLELADFKRRHRATSLTEVIVRRCAVEMEAIS